MKASFLKCLGLFCIIILTSCSEPHTHSLGSYESIDKNNHALICSDCSEQYDSEPHDFKSEYVEGDCLHESYTLYTCELCDYSYKEYGSKGEHTPSGTYVSSNSYHWSKCSICGATFNQENHYFKFEKHLVEPTCEQKGTDIYKCSVCGYEKEQDVNALGHNWNTTLSYDRNSHWEKCIRCGEERNRKNHSLDDGTITLEATCTSEGIIEYRCDDCDVVIEESIPKLSHYIDENVYLHDEESHWNECSLCHQKFNVVKHDFLITEHIDASHFNAGKEDKICKFCGYEVHVDYPILDHVPDDGYHYDEESHWYVCKDDGEIFDKEAHDFEFIENTIEPTCLDGGEALYQCSICGYQEYRSLDPLGHDYQYKYNSSKHWQECSRCYDIINETEHYLSLTEDVSPTCDDGGHKTYHCLCGYEETEYIDALGHDISSEFIHDDTYHWQECSRCHEIFDYEEHDFDTGAYDSQDKVMVYTCKDCGYAKTESVPTDSYYLMHALLPITFEGTSISYPSSKFTARIDDIWLEEDNAIYCYVTNLTGNPENTRVSITVNFQITDGDAESELVYTNDSAKTEGLQNNQRYRLKLWDIDTRLVPVGPFYIRILNVI